MSTEQPVEPETPHESPGNDQTFEFCPDRDLQEHKPAPVAFWMRLDIQMLCAIAVSTLLSALAWLTSDGINPDGILYVEAADAFISEGFDTAKTMYDWPFFSVVIGSLAKLIGSSYLLSAQLVSGVLIATFCAGFLALCREVFSDPRVGWGALISISAMLGLNEYRDYVIRDFGFWACLVFGAWALARAIRIPTWKNLLAWQACITFALMFRIEAIVYIALAPVVLLASTLSFRERLGSYLKSNLAVLIGILSLYAYVGHDEILQLVNSSKLREVMWYLNLEGAEVRVANFRGRWMERDLAMIIFTTGLLGYLFLETAAKIGLANIALCLYGWLPWKKRLIHTPAWRVVAWLLMISALIPYYFLLNKNFLQGRFAIPLAIFSLVLISGIFLQVFDTLRERKRTSIALGVLFCLTLADAFVQTGNSKAHILDAARWVRDELPAEKQSLSNHAMLDFYSGRRAFLRPGGAKASRFNKELNRWKAYDILMIREKGEPIPAVANLERAGHIRRLRSFPGKKVGRVVHIYEVVRESD